MVRAAAKNYAHVGVVVDTADYEDVTEMMTLFHVTGAYTYLDEDGKPIRHEDVFTKIEAAVKHYEACGLGEDYVRQFIR
jgi:hypothetical protein